MSSTSRLALALAAGCACMAATAPAHAITIAALPSESVINVGEPVDVAVAVSGLGAGSSPSLSVFDIDLGYDPSVLTLTGFSFGDPVLGDQLDLLGFGSIAVATPGVVNINLFELSFDSPAIQNALQAGAFTMATVTFSGAAIGTSPLTLGVNTFGDEFGQPLQIDQVLDSSVTVIPEPTAALAFAIGLLLVWLANGERRRTVEPGRVPLA